MLKGKKCQSGIPYPENLYFKNEGEMQNEGNKQKQEGFVARRPAIQQMQREYFRLK